MHHTSCTYPLLCPHRGVLRLVLLPLALVGVVAGAAAVVVGQSKKKDKKQ